MKVLESAAGAVLPDQVLLSVRISIRDLVADGKTSVRNSGVGGGGENLIFKEWLGLGQKLLVRPVAISHLRNMIEHEIRADFWLEGMRRSTFQ